MISPSAQVRAALGNALKTEHGPLSDESFHPMMIEVRGGDYGAIRAAALGTRWTAQFVDKTGIAGKFNRDNS